MKTQLFFLAALLLFLFSCSQLEQVEEPVFPEENEVATSYNVSMSEINRMDFSGMVSPQTKAGSFLSKEITPIIEKADTLLYVINYGDADGWVIASGDKRTPMIMAMSEKGRFNLDMLSINKGVGIWLEGIKEGIVYLKEHPEYVPDSTYLAVWNHNSGLTTKGGIEHEGEWLQLVYTIIEYGQLHYDIDHLTSTQWGQDEPWNLCMPLSGTGPNNRCSAGCTIVAAAQQAYYLNSFIGKPSSAFQYGTCTDFYYSNSYHPQISLYNSSTTTWSTMVESASDTSAIGKQAVSALMGEVANRSSAIWSSGSAEASLSMIRNYFSYYSVSCSSAVFNEETVLNDILSSKPVIVGMDSTNGILDSHTAVIDGAKVYSEKYIYYYQWMPIGTYPPVEPVYPDLDHPELYETGESWGDNSAYYFRINWGFDGVLDDGLYLYGTAWGWGSFSNVPVAILYNFH